MKWWENECNELEELNSKGRSDLIYARVKKLTVKNNRSSKSSAIKDSDRNLLTVSEDIRKR